MSGEGLLSLLLLLLFEGGAPGPCCFIYLVFWSSSQRGKQLGHGLSVLQLNSALSGNHLQRF